MKLRIFLRVVGAIQLILGLFYLLAPMQFLHLIGHSTPAADIAYPLGMLAARFLAYGVGMFVIAQDPGKYRFWILNMIFIQIVDFMAGIWYTLHGVVPASLSAFPMFNAALIAALLWIWRPRLQSLASASSRK